MAFKRILTSRIAAIIALSLFLLAVVKLGRAWHEYRLLSEKEEQLAIKISEAERDNQELREEIRIAMTPEAIERDGKARLNMKKPGERVVVVITPDTASTSATASSFWQMLFHPIRSLFSR